MARDPRVEPRVGDVITLGDRWLRVSYITHGSGWTHMQAEELSRYPVEVSFSFSIPQWQHIHATATIIHAEGE